MNSFSKFYFWYSVTIRIDSIQIRPNSLGQTKYRSYLLPSTTQNSQQGLYSQNFLKYVIIKVLLMAKYKFCKIFCTFSEKIFPWVENNPANTRIFPSNICIFYRLMVLRWLLLRMLIQMLPDVRLVGFLPPKIFQTILPKIFCEYH